MKIYKKIVAFTFAVAMTANNTVFAVFANNDQITLETQQVELHPVEDSLDIFKTDHSKVTDNLNELCLCNNEILSDNIICIDDLDKMNDALYRTENLLETASLDNDEINFEGKCGETVSYKFDTDSKTLIISGKGKMFDYNNIQRPWDTFKNFVYKIEIKNDVTKIGEYSKNYSVCSMNSWKKRD